MNFENGKIYPDCLTITRTVVAGGLTKSQLIEKMHHQSIFINELGERILADDRFTTSDIKYSLNTVEITVEGLGFPDGATILEIFKRASNLGLELCPLELGPHLRLEYLDQPEGYTGNISQQNQAPSGSVTIASEVISEDDHFPKGFYLRKINGMLWLRGYIADSLHVWNATDHFIFCKS